MDSEEGLNDTWCDGRIIIEPVILGIAWPRDPYWFNILVCMSLIIFVAFATREGDLCAMSVAPRRLRVNYVQVVTRSLHRERNLLDGLRFISEHYNLRLRSLNCISGRPLHVSVRVELGLLTSEWSAVCEDHIFE